MKKHTLPDCVEWILIILFFTLLSVSLLLNFHIAPNFLTKIYAIVGLIMGMFYGLFPQIRQFLKEGTQDEKK